MYSGEVTTTSERFKPTNEPVPKNDEIDPEKTTVATKVACNCCVETNALFLKKVKARTVIIDKVIPESGKVHTRCPVHVSEAEAGNNPLLDGLACATIDNAIAHTFTKESADPIVETECSKKDSLKVEADKEPPEKKSNNVGPTVKVFVVPAE